MSRPKSTPSYCLHKGSGKAYTTLDGRQIQLGDHRSPASREAYDRLIAEWLFNGRRLPQPAAGPVEVPKVTAIIDAFWEHAQDYYRHPDGTPTSEVANFRVTLRHLRRLYGSTPVTDFGPNALRALRDLLISPFEYTHPATGKPMRHSGWCRTNVNKQISRIRQLFKWAVSHELVPESVYRALATVEGLKQSRTKARESAPVKPIAVEHVEAVLRFLPPPVEAIVRLELLTGGRGGELCAMRGCDLDTSRPVWVYRPQQHKTAYRGHEREIRIGPRARKIVETFLKPDPTAYLFSPSEAEVARNEERREGRTSPMTPSQAARRPKVARLRPPGLRYTKDSYARAIARACDRAFPAPPEPRAPGDATPEQVAEARTKLRAWRKAHRFHPHQLRHTMGTRVREEFGIEAAQVLLGHSDLDATQIYAERSRKLADQVMAQIG